MLFFSIDCSKGLPAFLVKSKDGDGLNSGFMIAQYTAAALGKLQMDLIISPSCEYHRSVQAAVNKIKVNSKLQF